LTISEWIIFYRKKLGVLMVQAKEYWYDKRITLTVDNLRLWTDNPRFDEPDLETTRDFARAIAGNQIDKRSFFELIKSIVQKGFINIEPIVVFKDYNKDKYYVAEGNRRVLALKLLRNPKSAPKSIRSFISSASEKINIESIKKIKVIVAPSLKDTQWYIGQRNNISAIKQSWTRLQQCRWIAELAKEFDFDIEKMKETVQMPTSEIIRFLRINTFIKLLDIDIIREVIDPEEISMMQSRNFPVSIIERFFDSNQVQTKWGIKFYGTHIYISNLAEFLLSYSVLLKRILKPGRDLIKIDTRTITSNIDDIINSLPSINIDDKEANYNLNVLNDPIFENDIDIDIDNLDDSTSNQEDITETQNEGLPQTTQETEPEASSSSYKNRLHDIKRNRLVPDNIIINTTNPRVRDLFRELSQNPVKNRENIIACALRALLDLVVLDYLKSNKLIPQLISKHNNRDLKHIGLQARIEFIKKLKNYEKKIDNIFTGLLTPGNDFSLNSLHAYLHSEETHSVSCGRLIRFFDFLFPLFEEMLDLTVLRD
jgi:ParB-like chromosome segregation protein Spo0J